MYCLLSLAFNTDFVCYDHDCFMLGLSYLGVTRQDTTHMKTGFLRCTNNICKIELFCVRRTHPVCFHVLAALCCRSPSLWTRTSRLLTRRFLQPRSRPATGLATPPRTFPCLEERDAGRQKFEHTEVSLRYFHIILWLHSHCSWKSSVSDLSDTELKFPHKQHKTTFFQFQTGTNCTVWYKTGSPGMRPTYLIWTLKMKFVGVAMAAGKPYLNKLGRVS